MSSERADQLSQDCKVAELLGPNDVLMLHPSTMKIVACRGPQSCCDDVKGVIAIKGSWEAFAARTLYVEILQIRNIGLWDHPMLMTSSQSCTSALQSHGVHLRLYTHIHIYMHVSLSLSVSVTERQRESERERERARRRLMTVCHYAGPSL